MLVTVGNGAYACDNRQWWLTCMKDLVTKHPVDIYPSILLYISRLTQFLMCAPYITQVCACET